MSEKKDILLVIIENQEEESLYIEGAAKKIGGIKTEVFKEMVPAIDFIQRKSVDGIITRMEFCIYKNDPGSFDEKAGLTFLDQLDEIGKKIPVLGNSLVKFETMYPYFWEQMPGIFMKDIFSDFVAFIKNRN